MEIVNEMASHSSVYDQIWELERARLRGDLLWRPISTTFTLETIIEHLTPEYAVSLSAALVREYPEQFLDIKPILRHWPAVPRQLLSGYSAGKLKLRDPLTTEEKSMLRIALAPNVSIRNAPGDWAISRKAREVTIPEVSVLHSDVCLSKIGGIPYRVPSQGVKVMSNVQCVVGSDIFQIGDVSYTDQYSQPGSRYLDLTADPIAHAASGDQLIVRDRLCEQGEQSKLSVAFWLGYPFSANWGHWLGECLTRLALYRDSEAYEQDIPIIVDSAVPQSFLRFVNVLWPEMTVVRIDAGTAVRIRHLVAAPSLVCYAHSIVPMRAFFPVDHLSSEPAGYTAFKKYAEKAVRCASPAITHVPTHIFVNRKSATLRVSRLEESLERLATNAGFVSVNPSELDPLSELALFLRAEAVMGLAGSQATLGLMRPENTPMLIIGHDQILDDSRGFTWVDHELSGANLRVVAGCRDFPVFGRSQEGFHQDFTLSERGFSAAKSWLTTIR